LYVVIPVDSNSILILQVNPRFYKSRGHYILSYLSLKQRVDCSGFFDLAKLGEGNIVALY